MKVPVLVIEDNPANLELISYLLTAHGYSVLEATTGEQGLELLTTTVPALILCDIQLPGMSGLDVARELKIDLRFRDVPLVAITALAMVGDRDRILQAGFNGYVSKPIEAQTFIGRIEAHLRSDARGVRRASHLTTPDAGPHPNRAIGKGAVVLVVDDVAENREVLRQTLEPCGYVVLLASSTSEALSVLEASAPDLIISDLHLVAEPDFGLLEEIRALPRTKRVPLVMISATAQKDALVREARVRGAQSFLFRPIAPEALLNEVQNCLASPPATDADE